MTAKWAVFWTPLLASGLCGGQIIAEGTLADLKAPFPPPKVEYVEKQLSIVQTN